ncbi:MAG: c-type cytochrome [Caldilineaceae bacterium]|nr:c-type cytochrome [Caldilineaceae bacterium]
MPATVDAKTLVAQGDLDDPITHGAWLYEGNCTRCHGAYGDERVGRGATRDKIVAALSGDARRNCAVTWPRTAGGTLGRQELKDIAAFIVAWEDAGGALTLPELPPQPTATPADIPTPSTAPTPTPAPPTATPDPLRASLDDIFAVDPVARGAWLYQENCYRCHYDYGGAVGRMGATNDADAIFDNVANGNDSMEAMSVRNGGTLLNSHINAVISYITAWEAAGEEPDLPDAVTDAIAAVWPERSTTGPMILTGDATHGGELFALYCVACHGGGRGVGKTLPNVGGGGRTSPCARRLSPASRDGDDRLVSDPRRRVDRREIEDLVAYILNLPPVAPAGTSAAVTSNISSTVAAVATSPLRGGDDRVGRRERCARHGSDAGLARAGGAGRGRRHLARRARRDTGVGPESCGRRISAPSLVPSATPQRGAIGPHPQAR